MDSNAGEEEEQPGDPYCAEAILQDREMDAAPVTYGRVCSRKTASRGARDHFIANQESGRAFAVRERGLMGS